MKVFKGILPKILTIVIGMTALLIALALLISTNTFRNYVAESVNKEINVMATDLKREVESMQNTALEQIRAVSYSNDMIAAVKANDKDAAFKVIDNLTTNRKCEFFTVIDADGNVIARTSDRARSGDSQRSLDCVKLALDQKKTGVYFESTARIPLAIRAASPVIDTEGNVLGAVAGGFRLDTQAWVEHVQKLFGVESTTFVGKMRHITTLIHKDGENKGKRAVGTPLTDSAVLKSVFEERKEFHGESTVLGTRMKVFYLPTINMKNETMGILFIGMPIERQTNLIWNNVKMNTIVAVCGLLAFSLILYFVVHRIVGPIKAMTVAAQHLTEGALDIDLNVHTGDELEILADAFKNVAASLKRKIEVALSISKGDLTTWVPLTSESDELGCALIRMRYDFYDSTKDLSTLAVTVATEGENLTQINERLVANTNESAAQLKDVSASIDSLNTQTQQNAAEAREAEKLANQARDGSTQGREMMGRMMQAMESITKGSNEIKNIIRVIDDIAFQTNLLALNAAVEAARAGTHGKGFAVVAEEVRNLAARSAKAARETADLIEESIGQVETGSRVADETSQSLNTITERVEQVSAIITRISHQSDAQTQDLGSVNSAVAQLSTTADENTQAVTVSADAVTSIAATAQKLDSITKHFKANDKGRVRPPKGEEHGYMPPDGVL